MEKDLSKQMGFSLPVRGHADGEVQPRFWFMWTGQGYKRVTFDFYMNEQDKPCISVVCSLKEKHENEFR